MNTKELLHAYKLVRQDFIENFRPSMSGGLRIARKNLDWFLMDRVEKFEFLPETKIEYQPGIMLGTLELILSFNKK